MTSEKLRVGFVVCVINIYFDRWDIAIFVLDASLGRMEGIQEYGGYFIGLELKVTTYQQRILRLW